MKHMFIGCAVGLLFLSIAVAGCNGTTSNSGSGTAERTAKGIADPDFPDEPQHPSPDADGMVVYHTNIYKRTDNKRYQGTMVLFTKKYKDKAFDIQRKKGKACGIKYISRNLFGALLEYMRQTNFLTFPEGKDHLFTRVSPTARDEVWINQFKIETPQKTWVKPLSAIRKPGKATDRKKEELFNQVRLIVMELLNSGGGGTAIIDRANIKVDTGNRR